MLGVFRTSVSEIDPELLCSPALKDANLKEHFISTYSHSFIVNFEESDGFLAYSSDDALCPRAIYGTKDGIYCIARRREELMNVLKDEVMIDLLIESYLLLKRKASGTSGGVMGFLARDNYILYDSTVNVEGTVRGVFAANGLDDIPLYYGLDSEGSCTVTDDINIIKKVCGNSFQPISGGKGLLIPVLAAPPKKEPQGEANSLVGHIASELNSTAGSGYAVVSSTEASPTAVAQGKPDDAGPVGSKEPSHGNPTANNPSSGSSLGKKSRGSNKK